MAKMELSLRYQAVPRTGLIAFCVLWAVFGVAAVMSLVKFGFVLGTGLPLFLFIIGTGLLYGFVPFQLLVAYSNGNHLYITKDGIAMPPAMWGLGPAKWLTWADLKRTDFKRNSKRRVLNLVFKQGNAAINLDRLSSEDVERLLIAVEVWGQSQFPVALLEYRDNVQNENRGIGGTSYTQLWEEELGRRFNATTFVPLEPGKMLRSGDITVLRQLAFGGFSAVYVGKLTDGRQVVIKEAVTPDNASAETRDKALQMFQREADLLIRLRHPGIARVLDNFVEDGRNYLILEYIPGETLRELVKREGPLDEKRVWRWARAMGEILDYLHEQTPPVIHRDFTPDNLILRNDGRLVLVDFGAANRFVSNATGTLVGKQSYMPPEQVRGKSEPESDLYALGGTLQFLLTGEDPEPLSRSAPIELRPSISWAMNEIVQKLTEPDRVNRFQSTGEFLTALDASRERVL